MRLLREQLSLAARRRKRGSLLLGVRVPSSLAECDILGYDVRAWIRAGLVDFVTPADFWSTDFVARTEEFVDLAKQTSCSRESDAELENLWISMPVLSCHSEWSTRTDPEMLTQTSRPRPVRVRR